MFIYEFWINQWVIFSPNNFQLMQKFSSSPQMFRKITISTEYYSLLAFDLFYNDK